MIETVINRALDGQIVEMFKRCTICGHIFWGEVCVNVALFGECQPSPKKARTHNKGKYRTTPSNQMTLQGDNLQARLWGLEEAIKNV